MTANHVQDFILTSLENLHIAAAVNEAMRDASASKSIQDFIKANPKNELIAVAVSDAWPKARARLISRFIDQLGSKLLQKRPDWEVEKPDSFFTKQEDYFFLSKPAWGEDYQVCFGWENYGEKMGFGLTRNEDVDRNRNSPLSAELLAAVKNIYPWARVNGVGIAWVTMKSPASDWRNPEVLWRIKTDQKFLDEVADQLLEVARACEPIVDRLVQGK
jgi:hypothetical protein